MATVTEPSASPAPSSTVAMVTVSDSEPPGIVTEGGSVALMNAPVCELVSCTSSGAGWAMPRCTVNVAAVPSVTGEAPRLMDTVDGSSSRIVQVAMAFASVALAGPLSVTVKVSSSSSSLSSSTVTLRFVEVLPTRTVTVAPLTLV